jgi:hypothetical protein
MTHLDLSNRRPRREILLSLLGAFVCVLGAASAMRVPAGDSVTAYKLKSAFIYNFAKYTTWPKSSFSQKTSPLVVGIYGKDPFGKMIDDVLKGKRIGDHPIVVERFTKVKDLESAHILFLGDLNKQAFAEAIATCKKKPILLLGESPGFAKASGIAGFYLEKSKVRFEIHSGRSKACGLTISSQVLKLARIVE